MSGSGSGSVPGSGSVGCDQNTSFITVFPTPSVAMADNDETLLLTAALALSVLAVLFAVAMTILVVIVFYYLMKLRKDVKRLRIGQGSLAKAENGSSFIAMTRCDELANRTTENEISTDQKPPSSPTTPTLTTLPQSIPYSPPGPGYEDAEPAGTVRSTTPRDRYDNINLREGILPPELRTEENLEGRALKPEEVEKLREHEERDERRYETVEMRKKREEEAMAAARVMAQPPGGQEGGHDDEYTNPADAIKDEAVFKASKKGSQKRADEDGKRFKIESPRNQDFVPSSYTDVFDQLPLGETEVVKQIKLGGGISETSPLVESKNSGSGGSGGGGAAVSRVDASGYEDMPDDLFRGASSAPCQQSPLSVSMGNIDTQPVSPGGQRDNGKTELSKRYSHPSRRDARKEMVEVNPNSRKPVTLSSGRKKQLQCDKKRETEEDMDGDVGEGGESPGVWKRDSTDGPESKSTESSPTSDPKPFSVSNEASVQDTYAMVDMTGKHRYRAESDSMKKEGSGAPNHYTVKEHPPDVEGTPHAVVQT